MKDFTGSSADVSVSWPRLWTIGAILSTSGPAMLPLVGSANLSLEDTVPILIQHPLNEKSVVSMPISTNVSKFHETLA